MDPRSLTIAFAEAFCAGDLARVEALLASDLRVDGPFLSCDSREAYLRRLRQDPPAPGDCLIEHVVSERDAAAILYEYRPPDGGVRVAQFTRCNGGLITRIHLVFDTAAVSRQG